MARSSQSRRICRALASVYVTLGVLVLAALLVHIENHRRVRAELCPPVAADCRSGRGWSALEVRWRPSGLPEALRLDVVHANASTSLVRRRCDGRWTLAFGARIDVGAIALGESVATEGACAEVGLSRLSGAVAGVRVRAGNCIARLDRLDLDWSEALTVRVAARIDPETAVPCAVMLARTAEPAMAQLLAAARGTLAARYTIAFDAVHRRTEAALAAQRTQAQSAGGWVRRQLAAMDTAHELRITLPAGEAALSLTSTPGPATGRTSPELGMTITAQGAALAILPEELRRPIMQARGLRVRWNLDHDSGRVIVNDQEIPRVAPAPRSSGQVALTANECGAAISGRTRALFFVEADEHGQALRSDQLDAVLHAVEEANTGAGALVAVFVHGWQHSAAPGDSYVCRFSDLIGAVDEMEQRAARASGRAARRVLGVYFGWPGALYGHELSDTITTFWNRLQVADRLGGADALLPRAIEALAQRVAAGSRDARADRRSALIIAGHSMGARAVFHAVRDALLDSAASVRAGPVADLVLLVNPAFSADLYRAVHEQERECRPSRVPVLLFSSEVDAVTRQVYPVGQSVSYPYAAPRAAPFPEHIYTAANFPAFVTHGLRMELVQGEPPRPDGDQTLLRGFQRVPAGSDELYRDNPVTVFRQPPSGYPQPGDAWYRMRLTERHSDQAHCRERRSKVIEVDRRILPDHGTIYTPPFMEYVIRVLNRSALEPETVPSRFER